MTDGDSADLRRLLHKLRASYNDFDQQESARCQGALLAEESQLGQSRCAANGGARTALATAGMQRKSDQHQRVIRCLLLHYEMDPELMSRDSPRAGCSNWLGELHAKFTASVPTALFRLYCDEAPTAEEMLVLATFSSPGGPTTRPHRERGDLPTIVSALSKLVIVPLQQSVSFAIPNEVAIAAIAAHAPLVEVGAGTGYWSAVLQRRGVDILAFDSQPPTSAFNNAFFHARYTDVARGDGASIFGGDSDGSGVGYDADEGGDGSGGGSDGGGGGGGGGGGSGGGGSGFRAGTDMSGRAMLVAWPNNPDAEDNPHLLVAPSERRTGPSQPVWDAECLQRYLDAGGCTVCYVGEREAQITRTSASQHADSGASSTRKFQTLLAEKFTLTAQHALPGWPYNVDDLTIWMREVPPVM